MNPIITNIAAFVSLSMIVSIVYAVKEVLDTERILIKHDVVKRPWLRLVIVGVACSLVVVIFKPQFVSIAFLVFIALTLIAIVGLVRDYLARNAVFKLNYPEIGLNVYLSIPTDDYKQVAPGVFDRKVMHKDDIFNQNEAEFKDDLSDIDFNANIVLFVRFTEKARFDEHSNPTLCTVRFLIGEAEMNGRVYKSGDVFIVDPGYPRYFIGRKEGLLLITLAKK